MGLGPDELVTGEAVTLELPTARLGTRILSGGIDVLLGVLLLWLVNVMIPAVREGFDEAAGRAILLVWTVAVLVGVPTATETLTRGRSLGKWVCGLRTVRDDAGPIGFRHALTRALVGVVEIWVLLGGPALISAILEERTRRLGDLAAGTFVIRDRLRLQLPPPVAVPPGLTGWCTRIDLGPLPDRWALGARALVHRADQLGPVARRELFARLAAEAMHEVSPPPPPHTSAEDVVRAVLACRRERDSVRLARQEQQRQRWFHGR